MALAGSDLLVVQQQSGNQDIKSLSITDLKTYLDAQSPLVFKGAANMTVGADEPAVSDRVAGNLYINNAASAGSFAWTGGTDPFTGTIQPNAQAVWVDTTGWQVVDNQPSGSGVTSIDSAAPIQVNSDIPAVPIISVLTADTSRTGVVQVATDQDVADGTAGKVVTSAQLAVTNAAISNAGGGTVTAVGAQSPIILTDPSKGSSTPTIGIDDASTSQKGAVQLEDASAINITATATATTPKYVADYYLIKDFSSLASI